MMRNMHKLSNNSFKWKNTTYYRESKQFDHSYISQGEIKALNLMIGPGARNKYTWTPNNVYCRPCPKGMPPPLQVKNCFLGCHSPKWRSIWEKCGMDLSLNRIHMCVGFDPDRCIGGSVFVAHKIYRNYLRACSPFIDKFCPTEISQPINRPMWTAHRLQCSILPLLNRPCAS